MDRRGPGDPGEVAMDSEANALQSRLPQLDELRSLLHKYRVLISQLRLASKDFGDLSAFPIDHIAGALVVQEASIELHTLYDRFHEWYARQNDRQKEIAGPVPETPVRSGPRVSLVLNDYASERKVNVIRVLRENVPGYSLTKAKALVERELPAPIANGLPLEEAKAIRQKFEAAGAVCRISVMAS